VDLRDAGSGIIYLACGQSLSLRENDGGSSRMKRIASDVRTYNAALQLATDPKE
jgi:hypothetical protein